MDDLAAELTGAGLPVEIESSAGLPKGYPTALDMTAYRLVQEALTNVVKHAGHTRATVTVRYEPGALELEVLDDGPAGAAASTSGAHLPRPWPARHARAGRRLGRDPRSRSAT